LAVIVGSSALFAQGSGGNVAGIGVELAAAKTWDGAANSPIATTAALAAVTPKNSRLLKPLRCSVVKDSCTSFFMEFPFTKMWTQLTLDCVVKQNLL
jgi:hypothetical protein